MSRPQNILLKLDNVRCFRSGEANEAEPYMWSIFFKTDGETLFFDLSTGHLQTERVVSVPDPDEPTPEPDPDHHVPKPNKPKPNPTPKPTKKVKGPPEPTLHYTPGREKDLGRSARTGQTLPIPASIGEWRTTLLPIPIRPALPNVGSPPGLIGVIVVLLEEDNTPDDAMAAGKSTFDSQVGLGITSLLKNITIANQKITDAQIATLQNNIQQAIRTRIRSKISPLQWIVVGGDMDDNLGSAVFKWDGKELEARRTIFFSQKWGVEGDANGKGASPDGVWQLNGHISVV